MILVDTGALYALADPADSNHESASSYLRGVPRRERLVVTSCVLVELWFLVRARLDVRRAFEVVDRALKGFEFLANDAADFKQALGIKAAYDDQKFSLVDCLTMAACERLQVKTVFTFDRRDFVVYRPSFCEALVLVP